MQEARFSAPSLATMAQRIQDGLASFFFEYDTPRMVLVRNKKEAVAFLEGIGIQKIPQTKKDTKCDEEVIEQRSKEVCSCSILVVQGCSLMSV